MSKKDKGELIFSGETAEHVAEKFAELVSRNYFGWLEHWRATAVDDMNEFEQWNEKISNEVLVVRANAKEKILKIINSVGKEHNTYFRKAHWYSKSRDIISITRSSGFYDDLLPCSDVQDTVSVNVEYLIDRNLHTIKKKIYSQSTRL